MSIATVTRTVRFAKTPTSSFKSTVFIRQNTIPKTPVGGSFKRPIPDGGQWSDGIPEGLALLWASTRIFSSDGKYPQQDVWTEPRIMATTDEFEVQYSTSLTRPADPDTDPDSWKEVPTEEVIWMATRSIKNGEKGEWVINQVLGENAVDYRIKVSPSTLRFPLDEFGKPTGKASFKVAIVTINGRIITTDEYNLPEGMKLFCGVDKNYLAEYTGGIGNEIVVDSKDINFLEDKHYYVRLTDSNEIEVNVISLDILTDTENGKDAGVNVLDGTNFRNNVKGWDVFVDKDIKYGNTVVVDFTRLRYEGMFGTDEVNYKYLNPQEGGFTDSINILAQALNNEEKRRILPKTWYTLSFWAKGDGNDSIETVLNDIVDVGSKIMADGEEVNDGGTRLWRIPKSTTSSKHTYTFKSKSSLPATCFFYVKLHYKTEVSLSAIKLEMGTRDTLWSMSDADKKGEKGAVMRVRDWDDVPVGSFFQSGQYGDQFLDVVYFAEDSSKKRMLYMCVKNHEKTEDNYPYGSVDLYEKNWTQAEQTEFIATKLLLSERIGADQIKANELVVNKLQTSDVENEPKIEIQDGMMNIFGSSGVANIKIGIVPDGEPNAGTAIFQFFDNDGRMKFDLGAGGLREINSATFVEIKLGFMAKDFHGLPNKYDLISNIKSPTPKKYYRYQSSSTGGVDVNNGNIYTEKRTSSPKIEDGWYTQSIGAAIYGPHIITEEDILIGMTSYDNFYYMRPIVKIIGGKMTMEQRMVYWAKEPDRETITKNK